MMTIEEIRHKLQDKKVSMVAAVTGLRIGTIIDIRKGRVSDPAYSTAKKLSDYLEAEA